MLKKVLSGFVAFAFAFSLVGSATTAQAQSVEDLLTQLAALQAQLAALQGGTSATACPTLTQPLTMGSTGVGVENLQRYLMSAGFDIPAITAGVATYGYFGTQTQSALAAWQAANSVAPASGYFGPISLAKYNAICVATTPTTDDDDMDDEDGDRDDRDDEGLSGGEASLEDFNMRDGEDDDVQEGASAEVAEIEFDVEDGDVRVERLDLTFDFVGTSAGEDDPWDAFDTVTLWADGEEIASEDVSDEDDWLDEDDPQVFRFSGLDYVVREGEEAMIIVEVEAQNGVDGAGTSGANDWTISVAADDIRALDGAGIDQYTGSASESVTFGIEEEGEDEELTFTESDNNPDATVLEAKDDETSDWTEVFVFDVESEEGDIELKEIPIQVEVTDGEVYTSVVNDARLVIDGEEYDDFTLADATDNGVDDDDDGTVDAGSDGAADTDIRTLIFDLDDEDVIVEDGETLEISLELEFKSSTGNYAEGTTVQATMSSNFVDAVDAEGQDDLDADQLDGSAEGEEHQIYSTGLVVRLVSTDADSPIGSDEANARYEIVVEVTALDAAYFIELDAASSSDAAGDDHGFAYQIETTNDTLYNATTSASVSVKESKAGDTGAFVKVSEDQTRTFTVRVNMDNTGGTDGFYQLQINGIGYAATAVAATADLDGEVLEDYETEDVYVDDTDTNN